MNVQPGLSKTNAIDLLTTAIYAIPELKHQSRSADSPEFTEWKRNTETSISLIFGKTHHLRNFQSVPFHPFCTKHDRNISARNRFFLLSGLARAKIILEYMVEEVEESWAEDE